MNHSDNQQVRRYVLVSYDFSELIAGGSARAIGFARHTPQFGWHTNVITASESGEVPAIDGARIQSIRSPDKKLSGGIRDSNGHGLLEPAGGLLSVLSPIKRLLPLERQLVWVPPFKRTVRTNPIEGVSAVVTTVAPYASIIPGKWLAQHLGVPHVVDLRDDWSDRFRIENRSAMNRMILDRLMVRWLRRAAAVLVVSPVTLERLRALGINAHLVYNGYNEEDFADISMEAPLVNSVGPLTCLHTGWLGSFRSALPLLEAMERAARGSGQSPSFCFSQMGLMDAESREELSRRFDGVAVAMTGQQTHRAARDAMLAADVLVAIPGTNIPAAVTGKLFEYMRARRPILLLAADGAARQLASSVGLRYVADPNNAASIDEALQSLMKAKRSGALQTATDPALVATFTRRETGRQLAAILDDVTANKATN